MPCSVSSHTRTHLIYVVFHHGHTNGVQSKNCVELAQKKHIGIKVNEMGGITTKKINEKGYNILVPVWQAVSCEHKVPGKTTSSSLV